MRRTSFLMAAVAALTLALAPGLAHARAGSSSSMGSRGSQTYTAPPSTRTAPSTAAPMQRSMTQQQTATAPAGMAAPSRGSTFMAGMMGGLLGVGLGGLLFGHGFFGSGFGFMGFLGLLLQIALVGFGIMLLVRLFRSRQQPAMASGPNMMARDMDGQAPRMGGGGGGASFGGRPQVQPIAISPADYQSFEQLLQAIQGAWSNHDLNALRGMATPEMLSYFAEQLSDQASRGVRNSVTDVRLLSGDLAEAWAEGDREYATVAMKIGMIDVTVDQSGRVVDGDPNRPVTATEVWTFVRSRGGRWILSAIQQAG